MEASAKIQKMPLFSVVIPTHNRSSFLSLAIDSVLSQSYSNIELIILDNASTDETPLLVADYIKRDNRVCTFRSDVKLDLINNWKRIPEHVNGDYLTILSDDDRLDKNFFKSALEDFKKWPKASVWHSRCLIIDENNSIQGASFDNLIEYERGENFVINFLKGNRWIMICSVVIRMDVVRCIGGLKANHDFLDIGLVLDSALSHFVVYNSHLLSQYCNHSQGHSKKLSALRWVDNTLSLHHKMLHQLSGEKDLPADINKHLAQRVIMVRDNFYRLSKKKNRLQDHLQLLPKLCHAYGIDGLWGYKKLLQLKFRRMEQAYTRYRARRFKEQSNIMTLILRDECCVGTNKIMAKAIHGISCASAFYLDVKVNGGLYYKSIAKLYYECLRQGFESRGLPSGNLLLVDEDKMQNRLDPNAINDFEKFKVSPFMRSLENKTFFKKACKVRLKEKKKGG